MEVAMRAISLRGPMLLSAALLLAGSNSPASNGPAPVPYACGDGRAASVVYESGNDYIHAKALVTLDGRTVELEAAPTLYGVRYRGHEGAGTPLAWTLRGEE